MQKRLLTFAFVHHYLPLPTRRSTPTATWPAIPKLLHSSIAICHFRLGILSLATCALKPASHFRNSLCYQSTIMLRLYHLHPEPCGCATWMPDRWLSRKCAPSYESTYLETTLKSFLRQFSSSQMIIQTLRTGTPNFTIKRLDRSDKANLPRLDRPVNSQCSRV